MTDLRVACVGAGYFAQFHYDSWRRMPRVVLAGACDRDLDRAAATGLPPYDDLAQMLEQTRPDLLDIIVPPHAHRAVIETALAAGVRWLICQKPFCADLSEARAVTKMAGQAGATLIIHENFRFQPWYRALQSALSEGYLGTLHQMTFRLRPGDGQGPEAYLSRQPYFQQMQRFLVHETAVHWIDTFQFLLGAPEAVYADLRRLNPAIAGEDAGLILFDFPGGVRAIFDGNRHLDHAATNTRCTMGEALVEGTDGDIALRGDGSLWHRAAGAVTADCILPAVGEDGFGGGCVHALQCHVVAGVLDGAPLENRAEHYLRVIEIEEAIYLSATEGRKIAL